MIVIYDILTNKSTLVNSLRVDLERVINDFLETNSVVTFAENKHNFIVHCQEIRLREQV